VNPLRSVGTRLALALAAVVAGALALVYLGVVPSLNARLTDAKFNRLKDAFPLVKQEVPQSQFEDWSQFLEIASAQTDSRVAVYSFAPAAGGGKALLGCPHHDSRPLDIRALCDDPVAQRAADRFGAASGTVVRDGERFAEVAGPVSPLGTLLLLSASLHDVNSNVGTVRRRLLEAGLLAVAFAVGTGYLAAELSTRRIRRLEAAAERIAAGSFGEPIEDPRTDELGQLARAFERMRLKLAQLELARREFIGNASHELRTPLFSLRGFLELMSDEELDEATRREFLATMREQVDRLQRLAEDLLDLTRLDAGRMQLERRPVDLAELARELAEEFHGVARATEHPLAVDVEPAPALGDEERIVRIGRALLENALRHTPPGTRLRLRAAPTAFRTASLSVEDDGPGVPPEHARHVFDRFYRAGGTKASGSGLGLAIAHELAEAMGGELELESAPGRTVFTLRLPADGADPAADIPRGMSLASR
jgi:signal transduction histidine kinase